MQNAFMMRHLVNLRVVVSVVTTEMDIYASNMEAVELYRKFVQPVYVCALHVSFPRAITV